MMIKKKKKNDDLSGFKKNNFIYLFMVALGLLCCPGFSSCGEWRLVSSCDVWASPAVASLVEHRLLGHGGFGSCSSWALEGRLSSCGAWA